MSAIDLSRKYGIGESTIYAWSAKYAEMEVSELKRLRQLEDENNRLKKMYATLSMDHELLKTLSAQHPTYGFEKTFNFIRLKNYTFNHKRVYRIL